MGETPKMREGQSLGAAGHGVGNARITHLRKAGAKKYAARRRGQTVTAKDDKVGDRCSGAGLSSAPKIHFIEYVNNGVQLAPCGRARVEGKPSNISMTRKRDKVDCKVCVKLMAKQ